MKFLFCGNFNLKGTGYKKILENLAYGLHDRGHEVMILGLGYGKEPHNYPFHLVPLVMPEIMEALRVIPEAWKADRVIIAEDIPELVKIIAVFEHNDNAKALWEFEALYPIESEPLLSKWAKALGRFRTRYVISRFGHDVCIENGLNPTCYLPIGCNPGTMPSDKKEPRELLGWSPDKKIFLTVADNQERKGLDFALQAFARLKKGEAEYYLLTRPDSPIGYDLEELRAEYGIVDSSHVIDRGVDTGTLSTMYWAADALVVSSQAEGACLPIYEAAEHGLPVICGDWTGMSDFVGEQWMMPISYDFELRNPFGNVRRWLASVGDIEHWMNAIIQEDVDLTVMSAAALDYAVDRPWSAAVDAIEGGIDEQK